MWRAPDWTPDEAGFVSAWMQRVMGCTRTLPPSFSLLQGIQEFTRGVSRIFKSPIHTRDTSLIVAYSHSNEIYAVGECSDSSRRISIPDPVKRKHSARKMSRKIIISVDFGTTYSGVAYSDPGNVCISHPLLNRLSCWILMEL
jgi:hypothetical protein